MSFTTLRDIETCPMRWALRHGGYPHLWKEKGFPRALAGATIAGHVVHVALERIVRAIGVSRQSVASEGDPSEGHSMAIVVRALQRLGGISAVLEGVMRETVSEWKSNPRLRPRFNELKVDLENQLPALRPRVQQFLNRVDLSRLRPKGRAGETDGGEHGTVSVQPLAPGLHSEVSLVNDELGWYGKADLVHVSAATDSAKGDEIVDFKTGLPKLDHALQLRVYALLWARDVRRNPAGSRARRLTVLYGAGPVDVAAPISDEELLAVANELTERTARARAFVEQLPPVARPSRDACEWCDVRQMCPAYWAHSTRGAIARTTELGRHLMDAGVQIVQRQGTWSWVAVVHEVGALSEDIAVGARVLLRARPHDDHFKSLISVGDRLRIIGAQPVDSSEESGGLVVLSLTRSTEAYTCL